MNYLSTRNINEKVSGAEAIVKGLSDDGGLYVPESLPLFALNEIVKLSHLDYYERAAEIASKFLPQIPKSDILDYALKAYSKFDGDPAPLVKTGDGLYFLELWHGPTHAFKDIALTLLPYLLTGSKSALAKNEKTLILVATSGDTGKAALEGFKDVENTDVIVFYPQDGVSNLQKLQMMTQTGGNVKAIAIKGNFDDAQNAVKKIFQDKDAADTLKKFGYNLSSANSINFGRLLPQIVYYFSAYADLVDSKEIKAGEKINFCVPSGNFGNILAGYYAKKMGVPINKLICASNKNNVLTDFFNDGEYSVNREFFKTSSPSMDILISSNLERLLFEISGRDDKKTKERMAKLKENGKYSLEKNELQKLAQDFYASFADEDEVFDTLAGFFDEYGYIMDTHTAVALSVYDQYSASENDETKTVIVSTASPCKFVDDVLKAIGEKTGKDEIQSLKKLENATALPIPSSLMDLPKMKKIHTDVIEKDGALQAVMDYCKR